MSTHRPHSPNRGINCLFTISKLADQRRVSLTTLLEHTAAELPRALRFPEHACTAIRLDAAQYTSPRFRQPPG